MIISDNLKVYVQKLRSSNLRPTKQRLKICQFLFDREKTFHFTVETLNKKISKYGAGKVSLATSNGRRPTSGRAWPRQKVSFSL